MDSLLNELPEHEYWQRTFIRIFWVNAFPIKCNQIFSWFKVVIFLIFSDGCFLKSHNPTRWIACKVEYFNISSYSSSGVNIQVFTWISSSELLTLPSLPVGARIPASSSAHTKSLVLSSPSGITFGINQSVE